MGRYVAFWGLVLAAAACGPVERESEAPVVGERVEAVGDRVEAVGDRVEAVGERVEAVGERVEAVGERVEAVGDRVEAPAVASRDYVMVAPHVVGEQDGAPVYRREIVSPVQTVDRIFKSMQGPLASARIRLGFFEAPELLWVTGYSSTIVEADGVTPMSREFMCHSNMGIGNERAFVQAFDTKLVPTAGRLFSLAQGQLDVRLPDGFGMPWMSTHPVLLDAQVLNHNIVDREVEVRQRLAVEFVRDRDLETPLKPLFTRMVWGMKLIEGPDGYVGMRPHHADPEEHGPGCLVGEDAGGRFSHVFQDSAGRKLTGFWVVPPGREVNRTLVTKLLALPYDTTVHYIAVHLHPYAESVELYDLTAGETVYRSRATQEEGKVGLARVEYFTSDEGIPLYADHEYEVVSTYDNPTGVPQDAMASMFLYLLVRDLFGAEVAASVSPQPTELADVHSP